MIKYELYRLTLYEVMCQSFSHNLFEIFQRKLRKKREIRTKKCHKTFIEKVEKL